MKYLSTTPVHGQNSDSLYHNDSQYPIRVAIVDDDENDLLRMRRDVEKSREFVCTGTYRSGTEALAKIPEARPHVVLMDIRLPDMDGRECASRLRMIMPYLKIVFITGLQDLDTMNKSFREGANGYLTKPASVAQLLAVLKQAVSGAFPFPQKMRATSGLKIDTAKKCSLLSVRENEIMALVEEGFLDKEIADKLGISFWTVRFHLHNIFPKFAANNRMEAGMRWRNAIGG